MTLPTIVHLVQKPIGVCEMTTEEAWKIVGNQSKAHIRMMVKALSMMKALNTPEENRRLQAGKICLKTNNPRFS